LFSNLFPHAVPFPVLVALLVVVVPYVAFTAVASLSFVQARRESGPPPPSPWPHVSVLLPSTAASSEDTALDASEYPADRLELLHPHPKPAASSGDGGRSRPARADATDRKEPVADLAQALAAADGEILVTVPNGGSQSAAGICSMASRCTPETPVVVGPTIIEHDDRFVPRLHALQHLGRLAVTAGVMRAGRPTLPDDTNCAFHVETVRSPSKPAPTQASLAFNPDPDAAVSRLPAQSFGELFHRQSRWFRRAWTRSGVVQGQAVGLWLLHTLFLICSLIAVAVPAWRQPTLLALVGKMGADVVLTLPAAKHYGQRPLLRSIVPSELALLGTIPLAGVWALLDPNDASEPSARSASRNE